MKIIKFAAIVLFSVFISNISFATKPSELIKEIVDEAAAVLSSSKSVNLKIETLNDMIARAGGYTDQAYKEGIGVFRGNNQIILKNFDMPLLGGDKIQVPKHTSVVEIKGEIHHPGYVQYIKGENLKYYIESAGGFTLNADIKSIMVIYVNGDVIHRTIGFRTAILAEPFLNAWYEYSNQ